MFIRYTFLYHRKRSKGILNPNQGETMKLSSGRKAGSTMLVIAPEMTVEETREPGWTDAKSYAFKHKESVQMVYYRIRHGQVVAKTHNGRIYVKGEIS
jgi:hypothetical protein